MNFLCPWEAPTYLIFSSNIPTLLYYSHLLAVVGALIFGMLLFFTSRKEFYVKIFIAGIGFFSLWVIIDVLLWASNRADIVLFYWGLQIIFEVLTYATIFYFSYVFVNRRDLPFSLKLLCVLLIVPAIIYIPSQFYLTGVDISTCNANESSMINNVVSYGVEAIFSLMIVATIFSSLINKKKEERKQLFIFLFGILIFLIAFSSGNIVGSITDDWDIAQYGLFGMPIFIGLLTYLAVRFKTFNIKLFAAQALVIGLVLLIGSEFLFVTSITNQILVGITFVLVCIGGYTLVKSVKKEIEAKERIEKLAADLEQVNIQQESLVRFISHEMKGYLTTSAGMFASIVEGDFDPITPMLKSQSEIALSKVREGVRSVVEILSNTNAKKGTLQYKMVSFDFGKMILDAIAKLSHDANEKGLKLETDIKDDESYKVMGDTDQISEHVVRNLIDNSIKYTPTGFIKVGLSRSSGKILFSIKDTGVGITSEDMTRLFTEGGRGKDSIKVNVHSTGYGLAIAKRIVDAHSGRIWAQSEGAGKGSQFYVELPETK